MKSHLDRAIDAVIEAHPDLAKRYRLDGCSDEDIGSGEAMRRLVADRARTMKDEREEA